ncbi:uncharacterized protein Tco025E_08980 [Trypanosoma conorhini]|uniref:Uncharacterized protein n=1 Tax=Trypanosoma conorhini TaxID=83891 RepID=A0A3R7NAF1_9TRYP|nr:uncharacterized protein Tco025E_08980 [Trypanosoma conorhini]RNE99532.1 hypothetical protein Tco025E_08980 [Trypanosoma conorhini]
MLRWTGGSRARASFRQPAASSNRAGAIGTDTGVSVGRCHDTHHDLRAASHGRRAGRRLSCDSRSAPKRFSSRPRGCKNASVPASHEGGGGGGRRSPTSSTSEDGETGVDCTALEWSVKAAAAAAAAAPAALAVTAPRQEAPEGWPTPVCNVALPYSGSGEHALALAAATQRACSCPRGEAAVLARAGSGGAGPRHSGCGAPDTDGRWTEATRSPPPHVPEWESELGSASDATARASQGCFLWHLPESAEELELQRGNDVFPPLMWGGEAHHDPMNAVLDHRAPFVSSSQHPESEQTVAFAEEPVTALTSYDFPCELLFEEYGEPAVAGGGGGEYVTSVAPDCFSGASTTFTAEARGWRAPTHSDNIYAELLDPTGFEGVLFPPPPHEPFAEECPSPEPPGAAPSAALGLASVTNSVNQIWWMPPALSRGAFLQSDRGSGGGGRAAGFDWDAAAQEPHAGWPHSSVPQLWASGPSAARMRRPRRGLRRGQSLNLSGGVPSARFQAFQRRYQGG